MKPVVLMSVTLVTFPEASAGHRLYDCTENIVHARCPCDHPQFPWPSSGITWITRQWLFPIMTARNGDPGVLLTLLLL